MNSQNNRSNDKVVKMINKVMIDDDWILIKLISTADDKFAWSNYNQSV